MLTALKRLRLLNLSHNPLSVNTSMNNDDDTAELNANVKSTLEFFSLAWSLDAEANKFHQLRILIMNSCHVDLRVIECVLHRLPSLSELHLASNNYSCVNFSHGFTKYSLKILYFNNNNLTDWNEVCKLGKCFPNLENLVLSHNNISNFTSTLQEDNCLNTAQCFPRLEILILNKLKINEWSVIDELRHFPHLKHVRIQNIPLLNSYNDEEKYYLLVAHLDDSIDSLNGSKITGEDKENCERKYIRHYLDVAQKPPLYYELESKHGKLNKLADVNLEGNKRVHVKIKFRDEHIYERIDVRQTVGEFKKQLEKFVGYPASRFRVFYIDIEACSLSIYGPEEIKHPNRCLYSFNIRDGDEFEIDLKPPPVIQTTHSEPVLHHVSHHHHNYHSNCQSNQQQAQSTTSTTKPLCIRNKKTGDTQNSFQQANSTNATSNSNNNSANATSNLMSTTPTSRLYKRSGLTNLSTNSAAAAVSSTDPSTTPKTKERRSFLQFRSKTSSSTQQMHQQNSHLAATCGNENVSFSYDDDEANSTSNVATSSSHNLVLENE